MYNAFISYSHAADDKFAPLLQEALQKFAKPWYKKRNLEIFRDESSLSVSPQLWNNITKALDQSEYLILLASPVSENSRWVNREIEYWLAHKSIDTLLIALTDGTMEWDNEHNSFLHAGNNSLPAALDNQFDSEPFYIDLRFWKTEKDLTLINPIFKKEILKLAAKLHGRSPNDLASEEVTVHRNMILLRNAAIGMLSALLVAAIVLALVANANRKKAEAATKEAIEQRNIAQGNYLISEAKSAAGKDPTLALRLAEEALKKNNDPAIAQAAAAIYHDNELYKTILKKKGEVISVFFSGNDKTIGSISDKGELWIRDLQGTPIRELQLQSTGMTIVAHAASGRFILSGDAGGNIRLYDVQANKTAAFQLAPAAVTAAAVSPGEIMLLIGYTDGTVMLSTLTGNIISKLAPHRAAVACTAFSGDESTLLSADTDGGIFIGKPNGVSIKRFDCGLREVLYAGFSQTGDSILVANPYEAGWWNRNGQMTGNILPANDDGLPRIRSLALSPDGSEILVGNTDNEAQTLDLGGNVIQRLKGHTGVVSAVAFSHDGSQVVTGAEDGTTRLWHPVGGNAHGKPFQIGPGEAGDHFNLYAVAFSPDNQSVLLGAEDNNVRILHLPTGSVTAYTGHTGSILSVAYSPTGNRWLTGSADSTAILWDVTGNKLQQFRHRDAVTSVAFSPGGDTLLTGSLDGTACVWQANGNKLREIKEPTGAVRCVAFSPRGNSLLTSTIAQQYYLPLPATHDAHFTSAIHLWDTNGKLLKTFQPPQDDENNKGEIYSAAFSPAGNLIAIGLSSGNTVLWNVDNNQKQMFGQDDHNGVLCVAFSPDGKSIVTGKDDGPLFLWDLSGHLVQTFVIEYTSTAAVAFSPGGHRIISVSSNGQARLFEPKKPMADYLKNANIEPLSPQQKIQFGIR